MRSNTDIPDLPDLGAVDVVSGNGEPSARGSSMRSESELTVIAANVEHLSAA